MGQHLCGSVLGVGGRGSAASVEHVPQPGDPLIEGAQFEAMTLGIGSPFEATVAPRSHMVTPDCVAAGWRGWLGWRPRLRAWLGCHAWARCDDADVVTIADHLPRAGRGAGLGREVAHLALDHARVVPTPALLGR